VPATLPLKEPYPISGGVATNYANRLGLRYGVAMEFATEDPRTIFASVMALDKPPPALFYPDDEEWRTEALWHGIGAIRVMAEGLRQRCRNGHSGVRNAETAPGPIFAGDGVRDMPKRVNWTKEEDCLLMKGEKPEDKSANQIKYRKKLLGIGRTTHKWTDEEKAALLIAYAENIKKRRRFKAIAQAMNSNGYSVTENQCRDKMKQLKRSAYGNASLLTMQKIPDTVLTDILDLGFDFDKDDTHDTHEPSKKKTKHMHHLMTELRL